MSDIYFRHDYMVANDYRPDAVTLCARCARPIRSETYREMKKRNVQEKVLVADTKRHSDYRLVPIVYVREERKRMLHLPVCADCVDFELTPEIGHRIVLQIMRAEVASATWSGYPKEFIKAIKERWEKSHTLERLAGKTLEEAYNFKFPQEANT